MNTPTQTTEIAGIMLDASKPTVVTFQQIHRWVIWQFPRPKKSGYCGAVHPPDGQFGWIPAIIEFDEQKVCLYAHLMPPFPSPEDAADWLATL